MKIDQVHSHLNGLEFIKLRKSNLWAEIEDIIVSVDVAPPSAKSPDGAHMARKTRYRSGILKSELRAKFRARNWAPGTKAPDNLLDRAETHRTFLRSNQPGLPVIKDRVAIEVQIGKYQYAPYMLLASYVSNQADVGIEILPMKAMQTEMSSGIAYYESELYDLIREGRGVPPVPLVLIGIVP